MISNYSNHWYNQHTKNHNLSKPYDYLVKHLPKCNWFIAGGSVAAPNCFTDIDIFFEDRDSFLQVQNFFIYTTEDKPHRTKHAHTFSNFKIPASNVFSWGDDRTFTFQLVIKQFAPIDDILADFDISCSKLAMDPSGNVWKHHDHSDLIRVHRIDIHTLKRVVKYHYRKQFQLDQAHMVQTFRRLHLMRNDTLIDYYDNRITPYVIKRTLLTGWIDPLFLHPLVDYIDTLPARSRELIYDRHLSHYQSWENNDNLFQHVDQYSIEFQRHYSKCIKRIPAMIDQYPEDYL